MVNLIKTIDKPNDEKISERVINIINPHFDFDISNKITIKSDVNQFNPKNDKSVWEQGVGKIPHYHELYWDGVWLCDFWDTMSGNEFLVQFFKGFKNEYEAGNIYLSDPPDDNDSRKAEDDIQDEINKLNKERSHSEKEHIVKEAVIEVLKEKKKNKTKRRKLTERMLNE